MTDDIEQPEEPQDFQEEIRDDAEQAQEAMAAPDPPVDAYQVLGDMQDMTDVSAQDVNIDASGDAAQLPEGELSLDAGIDEAPDLPGIEVPEVTEPSLELPEGTAESPVADVLSSMEDMTKTAASVGGVTPQPKPEAEKIRATEQLRNMDLFEFDAGSFEADQTGMDFTQAESSYREVNYQWQRLMTAMVIDHQHRLEQLLDMLERER